MSNSVQGIVDFIKENQTKRGNSYAILVEDVWYSAGFKEPTYSKGDQVKFTYTLNGSFKNIDEGSVKSRAAPEGAAPKTHNKAFPKKSNYAAKDDYWAGKRERDISVTQPMIMLQSATKDAIQIIQIAIASGSLSLGTKKADQLDKIVGYVEQVSVDLFQRLLKVQETLVAGEVPFLTTTPNKEATQLKDEEQPIPEDTESEDFPDSKDDSDDWS